MAKILVSSCLLGFKVRYNGSCIETADKDFTNLINQHEIIPFCSELAGGLPVPRDPAEITGGSGEDVISGSAKVIKKDGTDLTEYFLSGAEKAADKCIREKISFAVLSERSPSCGSSLIYDGNFCGVKIKGKGVTAALLEKKGIKVFSQYNLNKLFLELKNYN